MTRKHFKMIADILREHGARTTGVDVNAIALDLASAFRKVNPRFDTRRFIEACTRKSEKSS